MDSVPAFRVNLGASDLNCVDVPLNPTHSLVVLCKKKLPVWYVCSLYWVSGKEFSRFLFENLPWSTSGTSTVQFALILS